MKNPFRHGRTSLIILFSLLIYVHCKASIPDVYSDVTKVYLVTKVYGLVNYYHPDVITGKFSFDNHFIVRYPEFLTVDDKGALNQYLRQLLQPLKLSEQQPDSAQQAAIWNNEFSRVNSFHRVSDSLVFPLTADFSWLNHPVLEPGVKNQLTNLLLGYQSVKRKFIKRQGVLLQHRSNSEEPSRDSLASFTLGLMVFWNSIEYYFPYKYLMDQSWSDVLKDQAMLFIGIPDRRTYYHRLALLGSHLDDSHGLVSLDDYQKWYYGTGKWAMYPLAAAFVRDSVYVKFKADRESVKDVNIGDRISHIHGVTVTEFLKLKAQTIIASNTADSIRQLEQQILKPFNHPALGDTSVTIRIQNKDYLLRAEPVAYSDRAIYYKQMQKFQTGKTGSLNDSTGYINLIQSSGKEVHQAFKELRNKKRIILDLRGYPPSDLIVYLARNLSRQAKPVASYFAPEYNYPGFFRDDEKVMKYYLVNKVDFLLMALFSTKGKVFPSFRKPYEGKLIVLIDEQAISYSETIGMIIQSYRPDSVFVGRQTNGANGNVVTFPLPFRVSLTVSGLHWHYANGKQLQRIGIEPDINVDRSYEEMVQGIDKILEAGLQVK